jgi:hypothetical protein
VNGEGTKTEGQIESTDVIDDEVVSDPEATVVLTEVDAEDDMSETVVDLNVEALVAKIEDADDEELAKKREAKKRLDQVQEQLNGDDEFGSTYAFDLDDDLTT